MSAARGDRKPCSEARCTGTMQFGREPHSGGETVASGGSRGWVCSSDSGHFRPAALLTEARSAERSASGHWDDDGGAATAAPTR